MELLPLAALNRETTRIGLAAPQADRRDRPAQLLAYASLLREIARRTGQPECLAKAASTAARVARDADKPLALAGRLEQARCARLSGELFADPAAYASAEVLLQVADAAPTGLAASGLALRAAIEAAEALGAADLDRAVEAAGALDRAIEALELRVRQTGEGLLEAAALRCDHADFLIGFGTRLKDRSLLVRAEADLQQLLARLDPERSPLSWARAAGLRGGALIALGDLSGEARTLTDGVRALASAVEVVDADHSPLDRAKLSHALALGLTALAEAVDDEGLFDHAVAAFDQAAAGVEPLRGLALRLVVAHDRAACIARRGERRGDAAALARAESGFRAELAGRNAAADPTAWAVTQLALARVYIAQAGLLGGEPPPRHAAIALTEALDVFTERGLKTLAETAQDTLVRLREACDS